MKSEGNTDSRALGKMLMLNEKETKTQRAQRRTPAAGREAWLPSWVAVGIKWVMEEACPRVSTQQHANTRCQRGLGLGIHSEENPTAVANTCARLFTDRD